MHTFQFGSEELWQIWHCTDEAHRGWMLTCHFSLGLDGQAELEGEMGWWGGGDNAGCLCFYHKSGDKQKQNKQNVSVAKCRTMERLCLNKVNIHTARSLYTHIFINIHAHKKSTPIQTQHTHTQTCSCTYNYIHPNMSAAPHLQHQGALTARFPASTHHHPPPPPLSPLFPHPSPFPQTHKASPPTQHTHSSLTVSFRNHGTAHSLKGPWPWPS